MTPGRRLLLVPLLTPLLVVLLLAALNPAPRLSLRLLIWRSASLPLGAWLAMAASGGALVSAVAVGLSLGPAGRLSWSERRRPGSAATAATGGGGRDPWRPSGREPWEERPPRAARAAAPSGPSGGTAGPSRPVGEPPPTVSVPFRVIQRPGERAAAAATAGRSPTASAEPPNWSRPVGAAPAREPGEGWGEPLREDW